MASDLSLKESLPELTDAIVRSYSDFGATHHLGHCPLPLHEEVVAIVEDLFEVFYPGYGRREGLHVGNITYHIGGLIDSLHDKMTRQFARALMHEDRLRPQNSANCMDYEAKGQAITIEFMKRIPALRRLLATDAQAAFDGDPACKSLDEVIFCYPGLKAITCHRIAHEFHRLLVPLIPRMISEWSHQKTGIDMHPGATVGHHFFIDHGTGVVIGETCQIGNHVKIYQGVTLGALSFAKDANGQLVRDSKRHPTLEDRVVIYANATVLGGKTVVGHDSVIGSSVWLTNSVEPFTTVTMDAPNLRIRSATKSIEQNYQI
jgi:serine O-acetyltransferase